MEARNVSASLSRAHTVARSAGSTNSPDIVTAMAHLSLEPSSALRPVVAGGPVLDATVLPRPQHAGDGPRRQEPRHTIGLAPHHSPPARSKAKRPTAGSPLIPSEAQWGAGDWQPSPTGQLM